LSLRRIGKNVGLPGRRSHPATLAATLLLGYYEVMSADHQKWTNHLLGAKQLLKEIDFVGMTRQLRKTKQQRAASDHIDEYFQTSVSNTEDGNYFLQQNNEEVDEDLISQLMGQKLSYDECAEIIDDENVSSTRRTHYTRKELDLYEHQRDLFWWFAKQDVYQSILSGNRLL
jgi:hypothetical protein